MDKKPTPPPNHRAYPRAHPIPRPGAAPRPVEARSTWSRTVPEGRRFPRGR